MTRVTPAGLVFWFLLFSLSRATASEPQLAHMVFFTLAEATDENREQLVKACHKYLTDHQGTVYFSAGHRARDFTRDVNDRQYDVALHMVFVNKKAHDTYQVHRRHQQFITENKHLWSRVRVFDSYVQAKQGKNTSQ